MFSKFVLQQVLGLLSFLWLHSIPLCGYTTFCLAFLLLMDIGIFFSTFWLLWMLLWTFMCTYVFLWEHIFSVFCSLGVELLGQLTVVWGYLGLIQSGGRGMDWMTTRFIWADGGSARQPPQPRSEAQALFLVAKSGWQTPGTGGRRPALCHRSHEREVAILSGPLVWTGISPWRVESWSGRPQSRA